MKKKCEICGSVIYLILGRHFATNTGYRCLACGPEVHELECGSVREELVSFKSTQKVCRTP
jgi:DNA-directed RNA polymerase subunit RPC12/RpoP